MGNYYPESKVEVSGFAARHYDMLLDTMTLGIYPFFLRKVIRLMKIKPDDKILDLGAGTGRNDCLMMKYLSDKGKIIGVDISEEMIAQFKRKCANFPNASIINKRIDKDLGYKDYFDKVFISFVLHGFPQKAREQIVKNAFAALKSNGDFLILDYNEFSIEKTPFYLRKLFKRIECPYAFEFIKIDCEKMLAAAGFNNFEKHLFLKGYIRLLRAKKQAK